MKETLIKYETAKLAKELGFNLKCRNHYIINQEDERISFLELNHNKIENIISRPTQSLLQKWLRDVHSIHIGFMTTVYNKWVVNSNIELNDGEGYCGATPSKGDARFNTYEEALEAGLLEALNLLKTKHEKFSS